MNPPRYRRALFAGAILLALGIGIPLYLKSRAAQADQASSVVSMYKTQPAVRTDISSTVSGSGVVESANKAVVRAKVTGEVARILHKDGDYVNAGDTLITLDSGIYARKVSQCEVALEASRLQVRQAEEEARLYPVQAAADLEQAKQEEAQAADALAELKAGPKPEQVAQDRASVAECKAALDAAKVDLERASNLYSQGAIPRSQLDIAKLAATKAEQQYASAQSRLDLTLSKATSDEMASAKARLAQAQQRLNLARQNLRRNPKTEALAQARNQLKSSEVALENAKADLEATNVRAPISGTVTSMELVVGDQLSTQGTPSTSVCQILDDRNLRVRASVDEVDVGKLAMGQKVSISFDSLSAESEFLGRVSYIATEGVNTNGVTLYDVLVDFSPGGNPIKPGMNADCHIILESADNVVTVPSSAIMERNGRQTVIVMEDGEPSYRRIRIGLQGDGGVEVDRGVDAGEQVVINPNVGRNSSDMTGGLSPK